VEIFLNSKTPAIPMLPLSLSHTPISTLVRTAVSVRKSYIMKCLVDNMAKGDSHMAKNVAKESCCIAPTLSGSATPFIVKTTVFN
jgi:hypothetical protein